jgi:hypothetical protein
MLDIWLVYWIPVSKGMEDAMSTPRIPPVDCPCGKAQTCYECTHPPSERDTVLDEVLQLPQRREQPNGSMYIYVNDVKELRQAGEP